MSFFLECSPILYPLKYQSFCKDQHESLCLIKASHNYTVSLRYFSSPKSHSSCHLTCIILYYLTLCSAFIFSSQLDGKLMHRRYYFSVSFFRALSLLAPRTILCPWQSLNKQLQNTCWSPHLLRSTKSWALLISHPWKGFQWIVLSFLAFLHGEVERA